MPTHYGQKGKKYNNKGKDATLKKERYIKLQTSDGKENKYKDDDGWKMSDEERKNYMDMMTCWAFVANFRSDYDTNLQESIDRHEAKPFFHEDGRAGVVVPLSKAIIETAQAQESKNPPSFAYSAESGGEDLKKAKLLETVVTGHVWYQKHVDLDRKMDIMNQDKMILGTMYQYVGYKKVYRVIRNRKSDGEIEEKMELYYDDICVDNLHPQDVWLHPLATCVAESPFCIIRKRYSYKKFLEAYSDYDMYKNIEYVKPGSWHVSTDYGGWTKDKDLYNEEDEVVVLEKWDVTKDQVLIYANGIEIFDEPNPYEDKELPITDYRNRLQYNTYLGEPEPERIATLSDAINAFINIAIDKEKRAGNGINLLDNNLSDFDDTVNIFDANVATRVDNPREAFVHYDMPGMSASTNNIIQMLLDFLIFTTGIDFRQITDLSSSTKATVAALRREISQQRIQLNVTRNENTGVKRLGWLLAKRVQQFYTIPRVERVTGDKVQPNGESKEVKTSYRDIRVEGMEITEVPGKDGGFSADSLRVKNVKDGLVSVFQARPEYLRLKGDIIVKVIPGSTIAAIKELQKNQAQEYIKVATEVMEPPEKEGESPKPILSIRYGIEKYIEAMDYDKTKAFDTENKQSETAAQDVGRTLVDQMNSMYGANVKPQTQQPPVVTKNGVPQPPQQPPTSLTGQRSEPVRELENDLGVSSRITKN